MRYEILVLSSPPLQRMKGGGWGALCRAASVYYQFDPYSSLELAIAIKPAVAVRVDEIPELSPALE
jgi:hypothetical protein